MWPSLGQVILFVTKLHVAFIRSGHTINNKTLQAFQLIVLAKHLDRRMYTNFLGRIVGFGLV